MKIVSVDQMIAIEKAANDRGLTYDTMMQNAGSGVGEWVIANLSLKQGVIGLIGSGNNGGDTLIALTTLARRGIRTCAFLVKKQEKDELIKAYVEHGGVVVDLADQNHLDKLAAELNAGAIILDGMLGTGVKLPLRGNLLSIMSKVSRLVQRSPKTLVIAVDCPSGVDCDTGEVSAVTLSALHTLTMAAVKQGLLKHPARSYAGQIHLIQIGIEDNSEFFEQPLPEMLDRDMVHRIMPDRPDTGHKGTFGTCLVVAGSDKYTGAAYLAGKAAYRAGCGLVNIAAHKAVRDSLSGELIEAVWTILPDDNGQYDRHAIDLLLPALQNADSLVIGPGWGLGDKNASFLEVLLQVIPDNLPTLFDADGLKLLDQLEKWWSKIPEQSVLTPHPGEMAALSGFTVQEIQSNRWSIAQRFAKKWDVTLLLKGAGSVIAMPDGQFVVAPVSDSGLATAGSGDVLSGLIGGFMAQGASVNHATAIGTWVHSQAGVIAHNKYGSALPVTACDILDCISSAISTVTGSKIR